MFEPNYCKHCIGLNHKAQYCSKKRIDINFYLNKQITLKVTKDEILVKLLMNNFVPVMKNVN